MIKITTSGSTFHMDEFLKKAARSSETIESRIKSVCEAGVRALAAATPTDSGTTAADWGYEIVSKNGKVDIYWTNSNVNGGVPIAILIQYGHGTGTGGYVPGRDFINPALKPIFDKIADEAWKAVTK